MGQKPTGKDSDKGGVERSAPPLTDRAIRIKGSLHSVETIVRDRAKEWEAFVKDDKEKAEDIKDEIRSLLGVYTTR